MQYLTKITGSETYVRFAKRYFIFSQIKYFLKASVIALLISIPFLSSAQNNKLGGWYIVNMNYHINQKFGLYGEFQTRSQHLADDFYYRELKAGIQYSLPKKNSLFFGLGDYRTYTYPGDFKLPVTKEFRIWEQLTLNNNIGVLNLEHRYRIEQRWINGEYANRFRYRLNAVLPVNTPTVTTKTIFVSAFDEVFFTNKAPYFLRNRIFAGAGYKFTSQFIFQAGFIRQFDYRTSDNGSGKNFLQASFMFNVNQTKSKKELHPSSID